MASTDCSNNVKVSVGSYECLFELGEAGEDIAETFEARSVVFTDGSFVHHVASCNEGVTRCARDWEDELREYVAGL